ncbi:MAG: BMP family ABC transporter substrate-binding protein [Oscillospiraceae bacterium]|jgi:basic membrane protein A|nr:BMP family ABC transporter substrate-binding protein [Oscillospiraceae bacterium]
MNKAKTAKKFLSALLILAMILVLAACGGNNQDNTNNGQQKITDIDSSAEITVDGASTNFSQDDTADLADCKICVCLAATLGSNPAHDNVVEAFQAKFKDDPGVTIDLLEAQTTSDWEPNLIAAANGGYDLILGFTAQMKDTMIKVAEQYPDQKFVSIDNSIVGMDNVVSAAGNCNEGCFIAGVFCAMLTTRTEIPNINADKKVGYVCGKDTPFGLDGYLGFVQGVAAVDPEIEVITVYGDSFTDPMGMKEWCLSVIENGCDVMYAMAGNGVYGAIEACQEGQAYLFGHDGNYDAAGDGVVCTSFVRDLSAPVLQVIYDFRTGAWDGDSVYLCTFTNGGMGLTNGNEWKEAIGEDRYPTDIMDALKDYMREVSDGTIIVDEYPDFRPYDRSTYSIHT